MRKAALAGLVGMLAAITAADAHALTLEPVGPGGYSNPTYVTSDPSNPDRLYVTEKSGLVKVTTAAGTAPILDLTAESDDPGERGVLSVALPPDFASTRLFYVAYTANDGALTLDEYREQATPAQTEATRRPVLSIANDPGTSNHNGGQLQFGPDGYLYWSTGDDAHSANAQNLGNLLGKILRIDPRQSGGGAYSVPPNNPFVGFAGARPEIWAYGFRNPWRFTFDRASGALLIGDVGEGTWEEVDYTPAAAGAGRGLNYGWPQCEGFEGSGCFGPVLTPPIYAYSHSAGSGGCAIVGGYVVRDPDLGALYGRYLFSDLCAGELRSINPNSPPPVDDAPAEGASFDVPWSFGEDACGRLYVATAGGGPGDEGQVFRLEGPSGGACPPTPGVADTSPPQTTLKLKPRNRRHSRMRARISSSEPGSTFECRLDRRRWRRCDAKKTLKHLRTGRHRFRARATDPAGNTDPKPAKRRFKVKPRRR